ncbi:hypothetical protein ENSA5_21550 [Enhygromyxa salina]|uniref:Uncharacterized protein n=1 Tax=Enhygromyxa salina TaxID=215803 RepID=A0A2S9YBN1_9BACT|nr:hypothetical protein [Enhygromyxa salina]PRQ02510.1 hypothetical protein ENSA5_21550 [Enhygromyxa salina]
MSERSHDDDAEVEASEGPATPAEGATLAELLEAPVSRGEQHGSSSEPANLVGECIEAKHPTLQGRVRVRFAIRGQDHERWVPTLQGLPVRVADRVLMVRPDNLAEWIVTGVVDGFATRPRHDKQEAARVELQRDEAVNVISSQGQPLVEISQGQGGPVVRVLEPDVRVEFAGKLAFAAEDIEFEATKGEVALKASADVVVKGETIRLN